MGDLSKLEISVGVVAAIAIIFVISWAVRCAISRCRGEAKEPIDGGALLNKEVVVVVVDGGVPAASGQQAAAAVEPKRDGPLCAICKARLVEGGGRCRRLRACGHVYHAECIDLWLQRKTLCPLCRAKVAASRTDIVDACAMA